MNHLSMKKALVLLIFSFGIGQLFGQEEVKPSNTSRDTLNLKSNAPVPRKTIDPALKFRPVEFYIINDKPVSKEEYLEYLRLNRINKNQ